MYNLRKQLQTELADTREALKGYCKDIVTEEFVWEPRPGMKSVKAQLEEVGIMEKIHTHLLNTGDVLKWQAAITWSGEDVDSIFNDLDNIRKETNAYLESCSDEDFFTIRPMPEQLQAWWGKEFAPEKMIRWILRHEYYHVGQITYNRWMLGHNPYDEA